MAENKINSQLLDFIKTKTKPKKEGIMSSKALIPFGNPLRLRKKNFYKKSKFGFKSLTKLLTYASLVVVLFVVILFAWFSKDLPTPGNIARRTTAQSTKIFDRNGGLLYETGDQKRTSVTSDQISDNLKKATIATEDKNFYNHHGIDFRGVLRAVYNNIFHRGQNSQGGSTLTQQYVKLALLDTQQTYTRKIKELILSLEIEQMYSKDQILTMYLNEIPYGSNVAGAEAASQMYFGIPAKDLSVTQAATLAAIPRSPTYYSPYGIHTKDLITRRNYVLDRMVSVGYLKEDEAKTAKIVDTTTVNAGFDKNKVGVRPRKDSIKAPHFALYVLDQLAEKYGDDVINKQGLKVVTTLDSGKQAIAEKAVTDGAANNKKYNANNAALTSIDPKTGQVLAMVGSKDFFDTSIDGNVNVATSNRQPGSSFKPIVYATAFKKAENSPSRILFDLTTDFGGGYTPHDFDSRTRGPVTMRTALSNSLNIPAVKTLDLAGIPETIGTAHDLGITTINNKPGDYGLALALGTAEVKQVDFVGAYSVFATGGIKHDTITVLKVEDNQGKLLYQYDPAQDKGKQVLDPQIAYEIASITSDNQARSMIFGAHSALYFPDRTVAAKTGTTSDFKDGWTMGFTPSLVTGVWVGNNDNTPMKGSDGVVVAGPIFHQYMQQALAGTPNEEFPRPAEVVDVTVDKYSNKLPSELSSELTTDIFATWQVPKTKDDVHVSIRVCKANGLLAGDAVPDILAEFRTFINLHSEEPKKPNFEGPVRAWAQASGLNLLPPTDTCDATALAPTVKITSPANNADISGTFSITSNTAGASGIKQVEYFIDNISIGIAVSPFSINYNTASLSLGKHKLTAVATDNNGSTVKDEITTNVTKTTASFSSVVAQTVDATHTKITWQTSAATTSHIDYGVATGVYTLSKDDVVQTTTHSLTITVTAGGHYFYKLSGTDSGGTTSSSNEYSFTAGS